MPSRSDEIASSRLRPARRHHIDHIDVKILSLIAAGITSNSQLASNTGIPLSTVQRRVMRLMQAEIIKHRIEIDYRKLGFRKGLLHVYVKDGGIEQVIRKVSEQKGIISVSSHIGNSDVVGEFMIRDSQDIIGIRSQAQKLEGVERVVWSEEVDVMPTAGGTKLIESAANLQPKQ